MKKVILLDRDGVINCDSMHYIKRAEEFNFLPGSIEAICKLTQAGYQIGIATNQSGISRGFYSEEGLLQIHEKMLGEIRRAGGEIAAIEFCPHHPEENCLCRKPKPELLKRLAIRMNISLVGVHFVGDRVSDILAAQAVGAKPIMILSSMTDQTELEEFPEVPIFDSLLNFVDELLK